MDDLGWGKCVRTLYTGMKKSTERTRKWREAHRADHNQYMRNYRRTSIQEMLDDPAEIWFEKDPRKRAALQRATPSWADRDDIRNIYQKCELLHQKYPATKFVVHHIIPINHPQVCGLHVAENLKVMSVAMKKALGRRLPKK